MIWLDIEIWTTGRHNALAQHTRTRHIKSGIRAPFKVSRRQRNPGITPISGRFKTNNLLLLIDTLCPRERAARRTVRASRASDRPPVHARAWAITTVATYYHYAGPGTT